MILGKGHGRGWGGAGGWKWKLSEGYCIQLLEYQCGQKQKVEN